MPVASGTWGSLPPAVTLGLMGWLACSSGGVLWVMGLWLFFGAVACVVLAPAAIAATGQQDPGEVVVDEVAGQALCFMVWLALPVGRWTPAQWPVVAVAGFLLFRLFDIFKPAPVRQLEALPRGWGILVDDLMAGFYAGLVLVGFSWVASHAQAGTLPGFSETLGVPGALILGAFQGVTEFLPVSSSGHLVFLETLMGLKPEQTQMLLFDLAAHVGTVLAVLVVMVRPCLRFLRGVAAGLKQIDQPVMLYRKNAAFRFLVLGLVGTAVTAVPGLLFKDTLEKARESIWLVGLMWAVTGSILFLTDRRKKTHLNLRQFGLLGATIVGLIQFVAILPGISRSGSTICAAVLLCGLRRRWAIEYSMLLGVLAIVSASGLEFLKNWDLIHAGGMTLTPLLTGAVTAFLVGIPALKWLIRASRRAQFRPFALYCYILTVFALFLHLV